MVTPTVKAALFNHVTNYFKYEIIYYKMENSQDTVSGHGDGVGVSGSVGRVRREVDG